MMFRGKRPTAYPTRPHVREYSRVQSTVCNTKPASEVAIVTNQLINYTNLFHLGLNKYILNQTKSYLFNFQTNTNTQLQEVCLRVVASPVVF